MILNFMEKFAKRKMLKITQKPDFKQKCEVIKKWMKFEESNIVDIPDFMKPEEEQFENRFQRGINTALKNNTFDKVYNNALRTLLEFNCG